MRSACEVEVDAINPARKCNPCAARAARRRRKCCQRAGLLGNTIQQIRANLKETDALIDTYKADAGPRLRRQI